MNRKEALKLVGWATANFPHLQERDLRPTAELWAKLLADIPYEVAEKALMKVLVSCRHFPTVAEIREAAADLTNPVPSPAEAWEEVLANISRYGHYDAERGVKALSPVTSKAVRAIGYTEICLSENIDATRAHFFRVYEQYAKREKECAVLPPKVREFMALVAAIRSKEAD